METLTLDCCFCGASITAEVSSRGIKMPEKTTLWADWFAHDDCMDKSWNEYLNDTSTS